VLLVVLMWLGELAHSHAVLPAFLLGLALARTFARSHQAAALAGRIGGRPIAQ
jgi:Kef-type K+ transport system membrane component KefB